MAISEAHKLQLQFKYGFPEDLVKSLEESGRYPPLLRGTRPFRKEDIDSSGLLIKYPGTGASTIRPDNLPSKKGRPKKYLRRAGEPNASVSTLQGP